MKNENRTAENHLLWSIVDCLPELTTAALRVLLAAVAEEVAKRLTERFEQREAGYLRRVK